MGQRSFRVVVGAPAIGGIEEWREESSVHMILYGDAGSAGCNRESSEIRQMMAKVRVPPAASTPA